MIKQRLSIEGIPAILWGPASNHLFIAVHGDQSNKEDDVIVILAEEAMAKGHQTLSFDLPEHGDRKEEHRLCKVQNCVEDLGKLMAYAHTISDAISLFGCSIGAYFSILAYHDEPLRKALFLSPVVNMKRILDNMMQWFDISEEQLQKEQEIATPAKTLYWDYYKYVLEHPVEWNKPTALLYGRQDALCEFDDVGHFAERTHAELTVLDDGEHYFHTQAQLNFMRQWMQTHIPV